MAPRPLPPEMLALVLVHAFAELSFAGDLLPSVVDVGDRAKAFRKRVRSFSLVSAAWAEATRKQAAKQPVLTKGVPDCLGILSEHHPGMRLQGIEACIESNAIIPSATLLGYDPMLSGEGYKKRERIWLKQLSDVAPSLHSLAICLDCRLQPSTVLRYLGRPAFANLRRLDLLNLYDYLPASLLRQLSALEELGLGSIGPPSLASYAALNADSHPTMPEATTESRLKTLRLYPAEGTRFDTNTFVPIAHHWRDGRNVLGNITDLRVVLNLGTYQGFTTRLADILAPFSNLQRFTIAFHPWTVCALATPTGANQPYSLSTLEAMPPSVKTLRLLGALSLPSLANIPYVEELSIADPTLVAAVDSGMETICNHTHGDCGNVERALIHSRAGSISRMLELSGPFDPNAPHHPIASSGRASALRRLKIGLNPGQPPGDEAALLSRAAELQIEVERVQDTSAGQIVLRAHSVANAEDLDKPGPA